MKRDVEKKEEALIGEDRGRVMQKERLEGQMNKIKDG